MSPSIHNDRLGAVVVQAFKRNTIDTNWLDGLIRERVVRLKYECLGKKAGKHHKGFKYSEVFEMYCSLIVCHFERYFCTTKDECNIQSCYILHLFSLYHPAFIPLVAVVVWDLLCPYRFT